MSRHAYQKGRPSAVRPEAETVMQVVKSCPYHDCGYTTNIKGDISKHIKDKHPRPRSN